MLSHSTVSFSVIKPCSYWNSDTLDSISDHANIFYSQKFNINKQCLTMNDYPKCLQINDADIHITFHFQNQGRFCCTSDTSKLYIYIYIYIYSISGSTGFRAWLFSFCVCCIFHQMSKITHFYLMVINVNGDFDIFEKLNSIPSFVQKLFDITTKTLKCNDVELDYHFVYLVQWRAGHVSLAP